MSEPTLGEVRQAFYELQQTVERKDAQAKEKIERINAFMDQAEEKIYQPLTRAQQAIEQVSKAHKLIEEEKAELTEKLTALGKSPEEIKQRIDDLELELARYKRYSTQPEEQKKAWKGTPEYKALNRYCQTGLSDLEPEHKQLLRTDVGDSGGYLVHPEVDTNMLRLIVEIDDIRRIARVRPTGNKSLIVVIRNTIPTATFEGETETQPKSVSSYQTERLDTWRLGHTVPVTMDALMNSTFDLEAEIMMDGRLAFAFGEGQGFVLGTSFKSPQGFVTHPTIQAAARLSGVSGELTPESILRVTGDLKVGYNPTFVLNRRTLAEIRTFRADAVTAGDASGGFLWMPGLSGGVQATLAGFPYILANSMPDIASDAFPVAFGDFMAGYTIVDRMEMAIIRDQYTRKDEGIVEFAMHRWVTGQVVLPEAIRLIQITT